MENCIRNFLQIVISYVNVLSFWPFYTHPTENELFNSYCEQQTILAGDLGMDRLLAILSTVLAYACLPFVVQFLLNTVLPRLGVARNRIQAVTHPWWSRR